MLTSPNHPLLLSSNAWLTDQTPKSSDYLFNWTQFQINSESKKNKLVCTIELTKCLQIQRDYEQDEHEALVFNVMATRREKYITFLFGQFRKDDMM